MRCKPGDLAVINRPPKSLEELRGRFVKVLVPGVGPRGRPIWTIDGRVDFVVTGGCRDCNGHARYVGEPAWMDQMEDDWLTPIRPTDGADETLEWAGKPQSVEA